MRLYLDTSAALKLLVEEPESTALEQTLVGLDDTDHLIASWLLHTELHCAAARRGAIRESDVDVLLGSLLLVDLERRDLLDAARRRWGLRSQDAIHLAVALRLGCEAVLTYDGEQADAARSIGLEVLRPS